MKKLFFLPVSVLIITCTLNAQTDPTKKQEKTLSKEEKQIKKEKKAVRKELHELKGTEVSTMTKNKFAKDFDNASNVTWKRDKNFDVAKFTKDGVQQYAYYDIDESLVGTTMKKSFADLPANAQKHINSKYADYTKGDVIFYDDNEKNETDMILFGQQFDDEDNYFIELMKNGKKIILRSNSAGDVSFFTEMK